MPVPAQEPSVEEVEKSIKELLRDEPVATLATLEVTGTPPLRTCTTEPTG